MDHTSGYLEIILGCMYAGKTSRLISIYKHNLIAEIPTVVINHADDKRYDQKKCLRTIRL